MTHSAGLHALLLACLLLTPGLPARAQPPEEPRATGLLPPSQEELERVLEQGTRILDVHPNSLALQRINTHRRARGLPALDASAAVPVGSETARAGEALQRDALALSTLPAHVDNSVLDFFPPIRSQGSLGSCVGWATTYYQLSHTVALQYGWDAKHSTDNTHLFSPKWTYNFINFGQDTGSYFSSAYALLERHGAATWAEEPYDSNYTAWPLNPSVWRNAIPFRANPVQYITAVDTPAGLQRAKELLTNGYVLVYGTYINSWQYTSIKNDPATPDDDAYAGKSIAYWLNGTNGSHAMTIVGFDDNIWTDINGNNVVDPGEKGALRIANSWGTGWGEAGFAWLAYDALKSVSAVSGGPSTHRFAAFQSNLVYHLTVRPSYSPKVLAELTLNHPRRDQLSVHLGISDAGAATPTKLWYSMALNQAGGARAFNGSTTAAVDGTFVLDFTDLVPSTLEGKRFHLYLNDNITGDGALLKAFRIIDLTSGGASASSASVPLPFDATTVYAGVDYTLVNRPPLVSSSTPASPVKLPAAGPVLLEVVASDPDADPLSYAWTVDGAAVAGSGSTFSYAPTVPGTHSVKVEVSDGRGGSTLQHWNVVLNSRPLANSPSRTLNEDTALLVPFTAFDADGDPLTFTVVDPPANGILTGPMPSPTYKPNANYFGTDSFTFVASDGKETSPLAAATLTVNAVNDLPAVRITAPANGTVLAAPATVTVQVTASDVEGPITKVALYRGTTLLGEDTEAPYSFALSGLPAGSYALTAKAWDATSGVATSSAVNVSVLAPTLSVSVADNTASEPGTDTGRFVISRSGGVAGQALTVSYTLTGTAANGTDFVTLPGSVTLAAGVNSATLTVAPLDDAAVEGKETVVLTLAADPTYLLGASASGTVYLLDDEQPLVTLAVADGVGAEPGTDTARFTVTRTGPTTLPLTVFYSLGGTAVAGTDYASLSGSVTLPAGASSAPLLVTPLDDTLAEGKESVVLTLLEDPNYQLNTSVSGTAWLVDDEQSVVTVSATDAQAAEPADPGSFTLTRTAPLDAPLTVLLTLAGTATGGTDYAALPTSVVIPAGAASATLEVAPVDDTLVEGKETVTLTLVADAAYQLVSGTTATLNLFDDEKPELRITAVDAAASESGSNPGAFSVTAIPAPKVDLAVSFTVGGTATNGVDYAALASPVTLPAGATSVTLAVIPTDDAVPEATETIGVTLTAQSGYQLGTPSSATVNLADDEPTVSVSASDNAAAEPGTNTGRFTLTRSGGTTANALTVNLAISGTATNGVDYATLPTSVVIPAGTTSVSLTVTPSDDTTPEGTETVILSVTAGGYRTGTASATVSLTDNE